MKRKLGHFFDNFIVILPVLFWIFIIIGYIINIVKFMQCDFSAPYRAECIHGIGIITGLGGLFGWMNLGK